MVQLLAIVGYASVVMRAVTLCLQSLVIGGLVFAVCVGSRVRSCPETVEQLIRRLIVKSAIALAFTQALLTAANILVLMRSADLKFSETIGANFVLTGGLCVAACLVVVTIVNSARIGRYGPAALIPAMLILITSVMSSHAISRMNHSLLLGLFTALHQGATATWIGGLPYLWISLKRAPDLQTAREVSRKFSKLAMGSVAVLAFGGLGLGVAYIGSWQGFYGTTYGTMAAAKIVLFVCLLALGSLNFRIVRDLQRAGGTVVNLRRFVEAEIVLGVLVILAAASLTSQPPAVDLVAVRVDSSEIIARLTPRWPRLKSPDQQELNYVIAERQLQSVPALTKNSLVQPDAPLADPPDYLADREWSEYNHHWAGVVLLVLGFLALAANTGKASWARNWPIIFLALAAFLFFRADPEVWPLGPTSFWASLLDPEVLQHRLAVALTVVFGIFEWKVRTGRTESIYASLVFPAVSVVGGAVLLTHSHALTNIKEQLLTEFNHLPLAILGVVAGVSRWLELRIPSGDRARPFLSWVWPVCFVLIGVILLNYREI
jgi:putative copper resistance protein D